MKIPVIFASVLCLGFMSCTKDIGPNPDLIPKTNFCDTITFTKNIMPIFNNECVSCHSPGGGQSPDLSDYNLIKTQVDGGRIKARMIDGSPSFMPTAGRLPDNQIDMIKCWLDAGAPNN